MATLNTCISIHVCSQYHLSFLIIVMDTRDQSGAVRTHEPPTSEIKVQSWPDFMWEGW